MAKTRLLAGLLSLALVLVACGGGDGDQGDSESEGASAEESEEGGESGDGEDVSGDVTMWINPIFPNEEDNETFWTDAVEGFQEEHPDVDVNVQLQPWENRDETIATALASGSGPDLVLLGPDQIPQYVDMGGLEPITDIVEGTDYLDTAVDAVTYDGEAYVAPLYHTATTMVYNKSVLDEAGIDSPPQTWDEVREAAGPLSDAGYATMNYAGSPEETLNLTFYPFLWQAGGSVFSEDGQSVAFDSSEGREALQFLVDMVDEGAIRQSAVTDSLSIAEGPLAAGEIAMAPIVTAAEAGQLAEQWGEDNLLVTEPLEHEEQVAFGLPGGLALTSHAESPEAAKAWVEYLLSDEVMADINETAGFFPPRESVSAGGDDPIRAEFGEHLEYLNSGEVHESSRQVMSVLATEIQAALMGDKSVEQALDDAAAEANSLIESGQ